MISSKLGGCCRRVLMVVLVLVLLVSACSPASEEGGGSPGAGGQVPGSSTSSVSVQRALDILEGVFTDEELDGLLEVFSGEELASVLGVVSEEELVEVLGSEGSVWESVFEVASAGEEGSEFDPERFIAKSSFDFAVLVWPELGGLSDEVLRASVFSSRVKLEGGDLFGFDANDVSTPIGAFCWAALRLREIMPNKTQMSYFLESALVLDWYIDNLTLWMFERETADRGLELEWGTGPTGHNNSLRRFLLQVTAPEFKSVVLSEGLPALLRPAAERFYNYFDELLKLPVYRARPTLAEVSSHPVLEGMTEEDIRWVWPEVLEVELSRDDWVEYLRMFRLTEKNEVLELLNSECKQRTNREMIEPQCPSWVEEVLPEGCTIADDAPLYTLPDLSESDCIFVCPEDVEVFDEPFEGFLSVSAGLDYACGVRPSDVSWCWNWWNSSERKQGLLFASRLDWRVRSVEAGWGSFSCKIFQGGELHCSGGRTPLGELEPPAGEFSEVSVGIEHACALRLTGGLACWGIDPASAKVSPPAGEFVSVDAGWDGDVHLPEGDPLDDGGLSCGLRVDAVVECWGEQRLSFGEGSARGNEFAGVAVGRSGRICVLRTDGVIHCGEDQVYGSDYPPGNRFTQVSVGGLNHVCGLRAGGTVECWEPSGVFLDSIPGPFTELEVGYTYAEIPYACGLLADGRILCWDLVEEIFNWAADGLDEYTHPICVPQLPEGYMCWNATSEPPREIDDEYVYESPILLPHSNSTLNPDRKGALEDVFSGEELDGLREVFNGEELDSMAGVLSEEELVEVLSSKGSVWESVFDTASTGEEASRFDPERFIPKSSFEFFEVLVWPELGGLSDKELRALVFNSRAVLEGDPFGFDANDVSTPTGAFCWVALRLREIMPNKAQMSYFPESALVLDWYIYNLNLWMFEREASDRGLELEWETGPTGYNNSLRSFLLQVTAPEFNSVVLSEGLPAVLRPAAERFYNYFDELLKLPVYRARPTLAEVSSHPVLEGMTEEDIRWVWPDALEVELSRDDWEEYVELFRLTEDDEVLGLLNSECKQNTRREMIERQCPSWVAEVLPEDCTVADDEPLYTLPDSSNSDCIFVCPEDVEVS